MNKRLIIKTSLICTGIFVILVSLSILFVLGELEQMYVSEGRKIIRKLNKIFEEKAEKRHIKLTGKTMAQAATDRIDEWLRILLK